MTDEEKIWLHAVGLLDEGEVLELERILKERPELQEEQRKAHWLHEKLRASYAEEAVSEEVLVQQVLDAMVEEGHIVLEAESPSVARGAIRTRNVWGRDICPGRLPCVAINGASFPGS